MDVYLYHTSLLLSFSIEEDCFFLEVCKKT